MNSRPKFLTLLTLAVFLSSVIRAGTLEDSANLFGNRAEEVQAALSDLPVSIETLRSTPSEGLRAYADQRVNNEFERGFFVVITTQPHAWRISMNPQSLASPERVRRLGDHMAASFKQGQFVEGAKQLAASLNRLTLAQPEPPPTDTKSLGVTQPADLPASSPEPSNRRASSVIYYPAPRNDPARSHSFDAVLLVMIMGFLAIVIVVFLRLRARIRHTSLPANDVEARKIFDAYTPAQRERLISRHGIYGNGDTRHDPMAFAMMMYTMYQMDTAAHAATLDPSNSSLSTSFHSNSSPVSFDSSSSSTSFDSSSSSSMSSSDSSGAGGSW